MSGDELRTRFAQEANKRLDSFRALLRVGPATPARHRVRVEPGKFLFSGEDVSGIVAEIKKRTPDAVDDLRIEGRKLLERRFDLLGYQGLDFGKEINWSLDPVSGHEAPLAPWPSIPYLDPAKVGDHKVTWELGRHQHLVTLARAWRLTGETKFRDEALWQWRHWREHNPYPKGIHWASALEMAFRAISWTWLWALLDQEGPEGQSAREELEHACGHAAFYLDRYLSYYFSPNTHLLGEAVALYALGQVFRQFEPAERWREKGRRIVLEQAERQVRPDGLYFEQSTYYHVYALDFLTLFRVIAKRNGDALPPELDSVLENMAAMLLHLSQGGAPPRFGDDDGGRLFDQRRNRTPDLLDPLSTSALLHGRADFKAAAGKIREETLWVMGPGAGKRWDALAPAASKPEAYRHDDSGWHVLVSAEQPPRTLILDAGPLGALSGGHGHADALSVQSIRKGREWLADPGTGRYPRDTPERDAFRSTAAHSTLVVDGRNQAEPKGAFGWESLPEAATEQFLDGRLLDFAVGRHHAYEALSQPVIHRRWALLFDSGLIFIRDIAEGSGKHRFEQVWRLGPDFRIQALVPGVVSFATEDGDQLSCVSPQGEVWTREIFDGDWSPRYGTWKSAPITQFVAETEAPCERATAFAAGRTGDDRVRALDLIVDGRGQALSVYRYSDEDITLTLCFHDKPGEWSFGKVRSDARLLAWEQKDSGARMLAAGASFLELSGEKAFRDASSFERFEWDSKSGVDSSSATASRGAQAAVLAKLGAALASAHTPPRR